MFVSLISHHINASKVSKPLRIAYTHQSVFEVHAIVDRRIAQALIFYVYFIAGGIDAVLPHHNLIG